MSHARLAVRVTAVAAASLLVPLGLASASVAAPTSKAHHRLVNKLPANLHTAGSLRALSAIKGHGRVNVMLELDAKPAAAAYSAGLHLGMRQARLASRTASANVQRQQRSVESHLDERATRATKLFAVHALYSGVAVSTDTSRLAELSQLPGVKAIHVLTPKQRANANTVPLTGAPAAWESGASGTGAGVTIGVIDTGIDYTHADFGGPGTVDAYNTALAHSTATPTYPDTDKVAGGYDFAGDNYDSDSQSDGFQPIPHPDSNPLDCEGHGSHVAGTAAGYGVAANGSTFHGPYTTATPFSSLKIGPGMAPGATLYALKVFGCDGSTDVVSSALDWAADPNGDGDVSDHLDVVNMSLGSDFASPEDPDAVATNNAVLAGITVAAAMGNAGDAFEVGGSPGSASRAIAVAASDDNTDQVDGVGVKIDGADAPGNPYPGELSDAYDWTKKQGVTNASLGEISAVWTDAAVPGNNADGCDPLSPAQAARVSGKVAFLYWTDNDVNRRCGSAGRSANVRAAGAIGALFGNDSNRFSAGITGDATIPVMITSATARDDIQAALDASKAVTVTLTGALRLAVKNVLTGADDPTDAIVGFSSRGIAQGNNVKPDVSAPGNSIVSVGMGTGTSGAVESGTSMASPHVAGEAALVIAAHPDWRPEQVKAAIMNTANHHVFPGPNHTGDPLGVLRAGAGRIDAESAVGTDSLAYVVDDPGVVSVSFGNLDVTDSSLTRTKQVRIENDSASSRTYALAVADVDTLPGADFAVSPTSVTLAGNTSREVTVTFTATRSALNHKPDPSLDLDPLGTGGFVDRDWASYATARLVVTPSSGDELTVPLYASPRVASTMHAAAPPILSGTGTTAAGTLTMAGTGVHQGAGIAAEGSSVSAFELQGVSPRLPGCGSSGSISLLIGCIPYEDTRSADLKYVGVSSDAPHIKAGGGDPFGDPSASDAMLSFLYFGITAYAPWRTAAGLQEYDVLIDTDGDFEPDLVVYNDRVTTPAGDPLDVFLATTVSLREGDGFAVVDQQLLNQSPGQLDTRKIGSDSMVLPVTLNVLAHPVDPFSGAPITDEKGKPLKPFMTSKSPRFQYSVESINGEIGLTDVSGEQDLASLLDPHAPSVQPFSYDPTKPGLSATSDGNPVAVDESPGSTLDVSLNRSTVGLDSGLGLLLIHHLNANGSRGEVVGVSTEATTTSLTLSPTTAGYWNTKTATATVTNTANVTKPNGGTVTFKDGTKVLATRSLVSGRASLSLHLALGSHHITATFAPTATLGGSTSSSRTLTVTKSTPTAKLTISPTKVSHTKHAKATVSVTIAGSTHRPAGAVQIYDRSKLLLTRTLVGGKLTVTLPRLKVGTHSLRAKYLGEKTVNARYSHSVTVKSI